MKQFNRTYAEVNLDAIRHNIDEVHKNIKEGTKGMVPYRLRRRYMIR